MGAVSCVEAAESYEDDEDNGQDDDGDENEDPDMVLVSLQPGLLIGAGVRTSVLEFVHTNLQLVLEKRTINQRNKEKDFS